MDIYIGGGWYEVSAPGEGVVEHGDCVPIMSPRDIYDRLNKPPSGDGRLHSDETLFYVGGMHTYCIPIEYARLRMAPYDENREGYELRYSPPGSNDCLTINWPERPHILCVKGLVNVPENSGVRPIPCAIHRETVVVDELDALKKLLEQRGHEWKTV